MRREGRVRHRTRFEPIFRRGSSRLEVGACHWYRKGPFFLDMGCKMRGIWGKPLAATLAPNFGCSSDTINPGGYLQWATSLVCSWSEGSRTISVGSRFYAGD